jgi:hypothetical protein
LTRRGFCNGLLFVAILVLIAGTTADPDLWGHLRFGQDIVHARTVKVADVYSFTSDRPWVNHEWLSEVAMAMAYGLAGPAGLNLLRIALLLSVLTIAWTSMAGLPNSQRVLVAGAGALGMLWRAYPVRPQVFSLFFFAILLKLIDEADRRGSTRPLLLVPVVMALWVNAHGGWIVGLAMFGVWGAMTAIAASGRDRLALAAIGAASLAATLANPYGYDMWVFLWNTVGLDRPMISDWQPLFRLPWNFWTPWIAALGIVLFGLLRGRGHAKSLAMAVVLGLMAIRVSRLDAFFAIAAMFFAARALAEASTPFLAPAPPGRSSRALACCFGVVLAAAVVLSVPRLTRVPIAPGTVPDAQVAAYVRAQHLNGTVLVWFDWGQYVIWQFGPDLKVSMDGRRETVYSQAVVDAHMRFYAGKPGAVQYAGDLGPDYIWIPADLPVVQELLRNGWRSACTGPMSVLLTRHDAPACDTRADPKVRFFPDL